VFGVIQIVLKTIAVSELRQRFIPLFFHTSWLRSASENCRIQTMGVAGMLEIYS